MDVPFLNIHTHVYKENTDLEFSLPNIIISQNQLLAQPCSLGIHPWYIESKFEAQLDVLYDYGKHSQVLAIGECGLDKLCDTEWELQIQLFRQQIRLANQLQKPLVIHCVRAYQVCIGMLREEKVAVPVLFHGFDKKPELAQQLLREGFYLSLGNALLSQHKDALIQEIPLERLFLETDDKTIRIVDIYTYFCGIRKIEQAQLKEQLCENFERIFNYPLRKWKTSLGYPEQKH